jgi:Protein of Unknown function (DUF2784)
VTTLFAILAALVVLLHVTFVAFAAFGGLLVIRWSRLVWVHVPAACWAAYVELSGSICPLTPLENTLRVKAGLDLYSGDFMARYVLPVLYPDGLTREAQIAIGLAVVVINAGVYGWLVWTRQRLLGGAFSAPPDRNT